MFKKFAYLLTGLLALSLISATAAYFHLVVLNPGEEIQQENIEKILAMESPVYYRDGQTRVGVFFQDAHRQYISYELLPKVFVNALVAAEDNTFFKHHGFDISGIIRAMVVNIKAGRIVQGGSTITQQTAKNLFKRKNRSLQSKLKELLFALRLEYHYPKEKIVEFYANQFYVSGNGHGIGVAAKYFFDKDVSELTTLECAFIAGSVKRPNYYNPFIKNDPKSVELAKNHAMSRATYVLRQMYKLEMIDATEYQQNLNKQISFNNGRMFYALDTTMDLVKEALATPEVELSLREHGIENVATSGISIFTTVDRDLQEKSHYALRKELSQLDIMLKGYDNDIVQKQYALLTDVGDFEPRQGAFLFGTVLAIDQSPDPSILVSFTRGPRQLGEGLVDKKGLEEFLSSWIKWQKHRWTEVQPGDMNDFLKTIRIGDRVYVSVRETGPTDDQLLLDLEKYPEIQGAALIMKDGEIRAMAGGMENYFFNRAISAKRPMGSVLKPLVYAAALQLGWNSADLLTNARDVFVYNDQAYFPRPDHQSPFNQMSMSWAGVKSENVATVWLLYHLCDRLLPAQFKELTAHLGLSQRQDESYERFRARIRDQYGVQVNRDALYRAAYNKAVTELETDLIFSGRLGEYEFLRTLHYGNNFENFLNENNQFSGPEYESQTRAQILVDQEIRIRKNILRRNFQRFMQLRQEALQLADETALEIAEEPNGHLYYNADTATYLYGSDAPDEGSWREINRHTFLQALEPLDSNEKKQLLDSILIEGDVRMDTLENLGSILNREYAHLLELQSYSPEVLQQIDDYRVQVGLQYLVALSKELGVASKLDPVLSFPLGSNVITLIETARIYQALTTGKVTLSATNTAHDSLAIIDRIEDSEGEIIFTSLRHSKSVFSEKISLAVSHILRNVVSFGTGSFADNNVKIHSLEPGVDNQLSQLDLRVPVLGKTGTANKFTNSAFCGIVPEIIEGANAFSIEKGYVVASYVGFDDNKPMVYKATHITGSSGALRIWTQLANAILRIDNFGGKLDLIDLLFTAGADGDRPSLTLQFPDLGQIALPVDAGSGVALPAHLANTQSSGATILTFGELSDKGELLPERSFYPFWMNVQQINKSGDYAN